MGCDYCMAWVVRVVDSFMRRLGLRLSGFVRDTQGSCSLYYVVVRDFAGGVALSSAVLSLAGTWGARHQHLFYGFAKAARNIGCLLPTVHVFDTWIVADFGPLSVERSALRLQTLHYRFRRPQQCSVPRNRSCSLDSAPETRQRRRLHVIVCALHLPCRTTSACCRHDSRLTS